MSCSGRKIEYKIGKSYISDKKTPSSSTGTKLKCIGFGHCLHSKKAIRNCKGVVIWEGINAHECGTWNGEILDLKKETIQDRVSRIQLQIKKEVSKT